MKLFSPAKLNLFLHIFQKRTDGFHNLETFFQLVDLFDIIKIEVLEEKKITVRNTNISILEVDDICYKAAKLLQEKCNISKGAFIKIQKNIPIGAGLGGGSSNAASVLLGLNDLWQCGLSNKELQKLGLRLGSDVPIFIYNKSCLAYGRGEVFLDIPSKIIDNVINNKNILLLFPRINVSTKDIFTSKLLKKRKPVNYKSKNQTEYDLKKKFFSNDFENVVFSLYPKVLEAKTKLAKFSKPYLTGTGSCLYSILDDNKKTDKIINSLESDYDLFLVKAIQTNGSNK